MQTLVTPADTAIAYTAAMIDGEGCIVKNSANSAYRVQIVQSSINNGALLCEWLSDPWGFGSTTTRDKTLTNLMYSWSVYKYSHILWLLDLTSRYMIVKRDKAISVIDTLTRMYEDSHCYLHWSEADLWFLRFHRNDMTPAELASHINRTPGAVIQKARNLGIKLLPTNGEWSGEELSILSRNYGQIPNIELCELLPGRTVKAIGIRASHLGLTNSWSEAERVILRTHYPNSPKTKLTSLLPKRTWRAIQKKANSLKIRRATRN